MHDSKKLAVVSVMSVATLIALPSESGEPPSGPPEMPPARAIPGINMPDAFPRGCVDCHINYTEMQMDVRLSTLLKKWQEAVEPHLLDVARSTAPASAKLKGVHPAVDKALSDIPGACLKCHEGRNRKIPRLVPMLHKIHLTTGDNGVFMRLFQGECTHCHKLDPATAKWIVPSGPET